LKLATIPAILPGEFQNWVEHYPLPDVLPFPQGFRALRYNAKDHVLGIVTGAGKSSAAASIMALGLDPRFDLSKAYWILAGIAGIDPNRASVGSAVWANYIVDGDLAYEIDAREIPSDWPTGIVAYDRARPFEQPAPPAISDNGILAYELNANLVSWAYGQTRELVLPDDDKLKAARAGYPDFPNAQRPPFRPARRYVDGRPILDRRQNERLGGKMGAALDQGQRPLHDLGRRRRSFSTGADLPRPRRPSGSRASARSQNRQRLLDAAEGHIVRGFSQERSDWQLRGLWRGD
jgi:hypothetical protein